MAVSIETKRNAQLFFGIFIEIIMIITIITGRFDGGWHHTDRDKDPISFWIETGVFIIFGIVLIFQAVKSFLKDKNFEKK